MANQDHVDLIREGVDSWNEWRGSNPETRPDLSGAELKGIELGGASLSGANLSLADLSLSDLRRTDLSGADLTGTELVLADLSGANLNVAYASRSHCQRADFRRADLTLANFSEANLTEANLAGTILSEADVSRADLSQVYARAADFSNADLSEAILCRANLGDAFLDRTSVSGATVGLTSFSGTDLSTVRDLGSLRHLGPSSLDAVAILRTGELPEAFRNGIGLAPSPSTQRSDCYIVFAGEDDAETAQRLLNDLRERGVRSWLVSESDLQNENLCTTFVQGVRGSRTVILLLSQAFVENEPAQAALAHLLDEEMTRGTEAFVPIILDDTGYEGIPEGPDDLAGDRTIADFRYAIGGSDAWNEEVAALVEALPGSRSNTAD